ncbi:hypothetical protein F4814DRAFT_427053 [Daldinia grandis]|nr:hypothetical protein F4814DRAFT_427053 [Daldinia grandis]
MEVATLPLSMLGHLKTVWDFYNIVMQLNDVPEASKVFVGILRQVTHDNEYARDAVNEIQLQKMCGGTQLEWIVKVITLNSQEIINFMTFVKQLDLSASPNFQHRVEFIVRKEKTLNQQEMRLRFSHSRLLTAINAMHLLTFQLNSSNLSSLSSPATKPLRTRASPSPPQCRTDTKNYKPVLDRSGAFDEKVIKDIVIAKGLEL